MVLFVACFTVVEIAQDQLYDEVTPWAGFKVAGGSLLLAALLTGLRAYGYPSAFLSMFTTNIMWTVLQGVAWFLVFMLVLRFHPWHAFGLGVATMLVSSGLATMVVDSVMATPRETAAATRAHTVTEPVRQGLGPKTGAGTSKAAEQQPK